jgi:hypothetical protein
VGRAVLVLVGELEADQVVPLVEMGVTGATSKPSARAQKTLRFTTGPISTVAGFRPTNASTRWWRIRQRSKGAEIPRI